MNSATPDPSPAPGLLDEKLAKRAVARLQPLLDAFANDPDINQSGVLHLVVMDPARSPQQAGFEEAILYEHSAGKDRADWDADYAGFARDKARLSWRTRLDSHAVHSLAPQRLRRGDTPLWGSVCFDGLVVAASGCEACWDEALSLAVAAVLRGELKKRLGECPVQAD